MNHTKKDRLDALLVSAQIIQRQCKFARVDIENFPLHGGFNAVVFDDDNDYNKFYFGLSMSVDEMDEEFEKLEEAARYIEDVVKRHNEYNNEMFNLSLESDE